VLLSARVLNLGERIALCVPAASADIALQRLRLYRLRAKVDLDIDGSLGVKAVQAGSQPENVPIPDAGFLASTSVDGLLGVRLTDDTLELYGPADTLERAHGELAEADWRATRIRAGLVDIDTSNAERFTPHMLNLDRTGAVCFDKGCYTGQEVVARTQHLGRVKRRVNRYRMSADGLTQECAGDKLELADNAGGDIVNASGSELLAVVPVEQFTATASLNGKAAEPQPLPYSVED